MWTALEKLINVGGKVVNAPITGRMAMGAVFGAIIGTFPLALVTGGELMRRAFAAAGVGAVVGLFYHRGYTDAESLRRARERADLEWRIKQEDLRKQKAEEDDLFGAS